MTALCCGAAERLLPRDKTVQCPPNFVKIGRSCFHASRLQVTWPEAVALCETMNAELASIESAAEQAAVEAYLNSVKGKFQDALFWLGATDILDEGHWQWAITLEDVHYNNWGGSPDNGGGGDDDNENCLEMAGDDGWRWNDVECDSHRYPLCEKTVQY